MDPPIGFERLKKATLSQKLSELLPLFEIIFENSLEWYEATVILEDFSPICSDPSRCMVLLTLVFCDDCFPSMSLAMGTL